MKTAFATLAFAALTALPAPAAEEPFDYFANNWNVIGLKDYARGTRVTPDNRLQLADGAVQFRFGRGLHPLSRRQGKTLMDGWLPILLVSANDGPVRYDLTLWATPLPTAKDWRAAFSWPTEGENFLNWVRIEATNTGADAAPARWTATGPRPETTASFERTLAPGERVVETLRFPFSDIAGFDGLANEDADCWLERTKQFWRDALAGAAHIEVPCPKATETLLAAHVCQLIASDHGDVHGGEGFYDQFYIRDGAYQVMELEEAGLWEAAKKAVALYLPRQRPDGRFESQEGQLDANGQANWVLWQYYLMTRDRAWLDSAYPAMRKAAEWTATARKKTPADSPFAGLLPAAPADGECLWDGKHHIIGYDFWNLRGLQCAADAAAELGRNDEADALRAEAAAYRDAIDKAWATLGVPHFPPSWEQAGTHWGNLETLWPTEIFARDDARVAALVKQVREDFFGGYVEGTLQWRGRKDQLVLHPYLGAYVTMTDLIRGRDEQVVEDFYWYLLHSTAAHAFPEGIYPGQRTAWNDTIPHVTGACNYAILLRHLLVHEDGDVLRLLSAVPDGWLAEGREIQVKNLPTHFGTMALAVRGTAKGVEVELDPPTRNPPRAIELRLPANRPLEGAAKGFVVTSRAPHSVRWDFPAVVARYKSTNPPPPWPEPDARSLSTGRPATSSSALPDHGAALACDGFAGDTDRYWATDVEKLNDPEPWWRVDLETTATISRVVVVGYYGDARTYGFAVDTSLDGVAWTRAADRRAGAGPSTKAGCVCRFEPRAARFVRVTETANSANTGRHLVEVMVYGE